DQLGQPERLGDAAGLVLHTVGEPAGVLASGAEQLDEVAHVFGAGVEEDVIEGGADQFLERVIDRGKRADRARAVEGGFRMFAEPRALAARQDDAAQIHGCSLHQVSDRPTLSRYMSGRLPWGERPIPRSPECPGESWQSSYTLAEGARRRRWVVRRGRGT